MKPKRHFSRLPDQTRLGNSFKAGPTAEHNLKARPALFYRIVSVLLAALVFVNCSLVSGIQEATPSQPASSTPTSPPGEMVLVPSPELPPPPAPLAISLQNPDQSGADLAQVLTGSEKLAAWLGLYQALGIPVIGTDRRALDGGDDPIGPAYWQIWYTSSLELPGHGIRLADAGRLFGSVFGLSPTASQQLGDTLLSDLRQAENSPAAAVQLLGVLSRERIQQTGLKLDIDDRATTAEAASIDIPTLQLIFWVLLRGALMQRLARSSVPLESPVYVGYASQPDPLQAGSLNCSEIYGDADVTYWTNWLVNKAFGGVQLPGMQKALPGLLAQVLGELGAGADTVATINKTMG